MGRYALLGRVGRGGMGEVHRARAFGAAGVTKELCIKRIRCERLADPVALGRFVAEARVSMRLSHANIVSVFDFGRSENDYYLAMEWVDGCDLRQLLLSRGTRLDEDVALFVAAEVARGLAYVHGLENDSRVAHCDLKPANVLLSRAGEVKLADFGVAVAEASQGAGGTRRYMAPEQWSGGTVGPRVDLYALGLVLDEMLGGTAARSVEACVDGAAQCAEDYVPPTHVSPPLAALLFRLCASDPTARPSSAGEVADALEALLAEARVRTKRSPRDLLVQEVAALGPARDRTEDEALADFRTDASYVTEGESETFARRMLPDASPRSEPRETPLPPSPLSSRWAWRVAPVALSLGILALAFQLSRAPAVEPLATARDASTHVAPALASSATPVAIGAPGDVAETAPPPFVLDRPTRVDRPTTPRVLTPPEQEAPPPTTLAPIVAPAVVRLNARPWAEVSIDGEARGVTPLVELALSPGSHDIVFTNPALGVTRSEHVELASGEHRDVIVDLRAAR